MRDDTIRPGKFRVEEGVQDIERRFALEEAQITFDDLFTGNLCELRCGGACHYCEMSMERPSTVQAKEEYTYI